MWNRTEYKSIGFQVALVASSLFMAIAATAAPRQTTIRLATLAPRGTSYMQSLQAMGEKWRQAPGGGVKLIIYPDGTMGSEADMVRRMRVGQIQAAMLTVGGLSEIDPSVSALQKMPMVYRSLNEAEYVRTRMEPDLEKRLADKGFVVLFWGDAGWVRFFSKAPAYTPEDFKKMKVFVTAGDNNEVEIMKAAGYRPVALEWTDTLISLQTGLIDAVPAPPFLALAGQYNTVTRHMLEVDWVPLVGATVITKKAWEALSAEARDAMRTTAAEAGQQIQARSREESDESVAAMQKRGLQIHTMTPEMEVEWRRFAESVYPKIRGKMVPADMFDEVQRLLAEYRAGHNKGQS